MMAFFFGCTTHTHTVTHREREGDIARQAIGVPAKLVMSWLKLSQHNCQLASSQRSAILAHSYMLGWRSSGCQSRGTCTWASRSIRLHFSNLITSSAIKASVSLYRYDVNALPNWFDVPNGPTPSIDLHCPKRLPSNQLFLSIDSTDNSLNCGVLLFQVLAQ